jgi:16S rRNA (cytosine967-C5)-methyltransferase
LDSSEVRAAAARAVVAVAAHGRTLEAALAAERARGAAGPAVQALAFGTVRWLPELDVLLGLLTGPRSARLEPEVRAVALVGLFQLVHARTPAHAAVAETVEAVRRIGRPRAAGLVNAVLRRFLRESDALLAEARRDPEARFAHPAWLMRRLADDWPGFDAAILEAGNAPPPMWLRVNVARIEPAACRDKLAAAGLAAGGCDFAPSALKLESPLDVAALPGFAEGELSVQDAAAQLAAPLLAAAPGLRVLDACAAPGGKACHVLEATPGLAALVAVEIDPVRAGRIRDNLSRLGLEAEVVVGDAARPADWWDGRPFDRILLDVPCSGTGVIRRHPDIKLLRRESDLAGFAATQRGLLEAVWPLLAPGGRLVYSTCSVLRAENEAVVAGFLAACPAAADATESARLSVDGQLPAGGPGPGLSLPTGFADTDGFYYACLEKRA